jgi:hypothetical protein
MAMPASKGTHENIVRGGSGWEVCGCNGLAGGRENGGTLYIYTHTCICAQTTHGGFIELDQYTACRGPAGDGIHPLEERYPIVEISNCAETGEVA